MNTYLKISLHLIISMFFITLIYYCVSCYLVDTVSIKIDTLSPMVKKDSSLLVLKTKVLPVKLSKRNVVLYYHDYNKRLTFKDYVIALMTLNMKSKYHELSIGEIVGTQGDKLIYSNGILYRIDDGKKVEVKKFGNDYKKMFSSEIEYKLKKDEVFILTLSNTPDSSMGNIFKYSDIEARVMMQYLPLKDYGLLKISQ